MVTCIQREAYFINEMKLRFACNLREYECSYIAVLLFSYPIMLRFQMYTDVLMTVCASLSRVMCEHQHLYPHVLVAFDE